MQPIKKKVFQSYCELLQRSSMFKKERKVSDKKVPFEQCYQVNQYQYKSFVKCEG